ncbi:hypothetical protein ACTQ6A_12740 [Lachnospiraceae bacterium LCP25S3_G4]
MKKNIIGGIVGVIFLGVIGTCIWFNYNKYDVKKEVVNLELGDTLSSDTKKYISANEKAIDETFLDVSKVDNMKEGTYIVTANYKNKEASFEVEVKDTKSPEVKLTSKEPIKVVVGETIPASKIIASLNDDGGIKSLKFNSNQVEVKNDDKKDDKKDDIIARLGLKYDKVGEQKNTIIAVDNSGNETKTELVIKVIENYLDHVNGFQDIVLEAGSTIDWMAGINKDEKIVEIKPIADSIDINTPGEYQLKYNIIGDDKETVVEKTVKVTVVNPEEAQAIANNGGTVKISGGETKQAYVAPTPTQAASSSNTYNGSTSNSNSGGKQYTTGTLQTTHTGSGVIDGGNRTWDSYEGYGDFEGYNGIEVHE